MKHLLLAAPKELTLTSDAAPFCVVALSDDSISRQKAIQVCSDLFSQFGSEFEFNRNMWQFNELGATNEGRKAASVAGAADLIIFASSHDTLPETIKLWIEMWLAKKSDQETALVAMIGIPNAHDRPSTPAHLYLETIARQTGMTYFPGHFWTPRPIPTTSIEAIVARASASSEVLDQILHHHFPPPSIRWGINE